MAFAYSEMGQMDRDNKFLVFTTIGKVSAFRILNIGFALVIFMCCEIVSFGSRVNPRIFECIFVGDVSYLI